MLHWWRFHSDEKIVIIQPIDCLLQSSKDLFHLRKQPSHSPKKCFQIFLDFKKRTRFLLSNQITFTSSLECLKVASNDAISFGRVSKHRRQKSSFLVAAFWDKTPKLMTSTPSITAFLFRICFGLCFKNF